MESKDSPAVPPAEKPLHPLPAWGWIWAIGGGLQILIGISLLIVLAMPPAGAQASGRYMASIVLAALAALVLVNGGFHIWFWQRFVLQQRLCRSTWHIGIGLILLDSACFFFMGWPVTGVIALLVLANWTQGLTKQHFEKAQ